MTASPRPQTGSNAPAVSRWALVVMMVAIGVLHFPFVDVFAQIVPPALPWPRELVWISGVFEIGLGLALLPERTRKLAGYGLVALYIAVFPANIYMAIADVHIRGMAPVSPILLWGRLPLQFALIAWALRVGRTGNRAEDVVASERDREPSATA